VVLCLFIHSRYCPNCELFKEGVLEREYKGHLIRIHTLSKGIISAYNVVKNICSAVGIPCTSIDLAQDLGISDDEYQTKFIPILSKNGVLSSRFITISPYRYFVHEWLKEKEAVELPCFLIKSTIARDRYVNVEMRLDDPYVPLDWVATRQTLRTIARVAIEEKLIVSGLEPRHEIIEHILSRLFPVNEVGDVDEMRWIRSFIALKHMRVRQ